MDTITMLARRKSLPKYNVVSFALTYITFGVVTWKKNKKIDTFWFVLQHMPSSVL